MVARFSKPLVSVLMCLCVRFSIAAQATPVPSPGATARAVVLQKILVDPQPDRLIVKVTASGRITAEATRLANPDRLVFDFAGVEFNRANRHIPLTHGPVKELRLAQFGVHPPVSRIVVELKKPLNFLVSPSGNEVVIEIDYSETERAAETSPPPPATPAAGIEPQAQSNPEPPRQRIPELQPSPVREIAGIPKIMLAPTVAITPPPLVENGPIRGSQPRPDSERLRLPDPEVAKPPAREQPRPSNAEPSQPPNREIAGRAGPPTLGAYVLMAQARALSVADLQSLEDKAAAGDPEAQTMFALAYHAGVLLRKDDVEALRLLRKAADRSFPAAEESLGIFTQTGVGTAPDPVSALAWYKKAAEHGSLDAATNIALIYANGNGVAEDPVQAVRWFRRAAEGGDGSAQYNLALMYDRGEGVSQDHAESVRWLTAAADQNVIPALLDLGRSCLHPSDSGKPDVERAIRYYTKAADLGSALAQAILGNVFANGAQGKVDYEQSVKWYRKAAEQGQPDGQFGLGVRYALGQGVPVDFAEARRLFEAAAAQGLANAQFNLATMYEEGKGSPVDAEQAAHYYQLAADQGFGAAQFRYGRFLARSAASRDRVAAYKWLMLAQDSIQPSAAALRDLRNSMTAQEIAEAEHDVDKWRVEHQSSAH